MLVYLISRMAIISLLVLSNINCSLAQERLVRQCGTMQLLEYTFERNPSGKITFEKQTREIQQAVKKRKAALQTSPIEGTTTTFIPVVFHIVLPNPESVTDDQIHAQLDILNKDFAGLNNDSINIPIAFKPLFGKSKIQFTLAQRTPDDEPATGIVRTVTTRPVYTTFDITLKYSLLGGDDAWDHNRFLNVWVTNLSGGFVLGYATMPGTSVPAEDGIVIHYATLPGSAPAAFNKGRTLTHETGHYFYLYHIWGDENGCTGTDYVDDTPNQTTLTSGCPGGAFVTDACTPVAPGILYEDYMDYTDDACMCLFTNDQVTRMETALNDYRAGFYTSNGAEPVTLYSLDAVAKNIIAPAQRVCAATFSPVITLRNRGSQLLSSVDFYVSIDNGPATLTHWTGSLNSLHETAVTLNSLTVTEGQHVLKVVVSSPNGSADQNTANDTITGLFQYYQAGSPPFTEGFESNTFPVAGWDINNPDRFTTWERVTGVAKTGHASVVLRNFDYGLIGQKDYLWLPHINITRADSAFLIFQVAAGVRSDPSLPGNKDTLQVVVSTDCGATYTSLYKKGGSSLITHNTPVSTSFVPTASEWRKEFVNLTPYVNAGPIMLGFMNTTAFGNNIYLDDIDIYSADINPNLREKGFMVTPNPATSTIAVQFYPNPVTLKNIVIYNSSGQKIAAQTANGSSSYNFNMGRFASGVYIVQAIFTDKKITQKVIKR